MFKCKQCGYEGDYTAEPCANCGAEPVIDEQDVAITKRELEKALADRNIGKIFASRHLLADSGNAIAQREFAKLPLLSQIATQEAQTDSLRAKALSRIRARAKEASRDTPSADP